MVLHPWHSSEANAALGENAEIPKRDGTQYARDDAVLFGLDAQERRNTVCQR